MTDDLTRILLVDNQVDAREWLAEWLRHHDRFDVRTADNSEQCLEQLHKTEGKCDVIVMDLMLGKGPDGISTMKEVRQRYPGIETIIITGFGDRQDGIRAIKAGAYKYILKPFEKEELVVYIRHAAERRKLISEVSRAKIYETFTALRMGRDLPGILNLIVDNLHGLFDLTTCTVMLLDPQKTRLEVVAEKGLGKKVVRLISDLPKDLKKVFVNDEPLEIPNLDQRLDWKRALVRSDLKSFTLLPLRDRNGEPLGVVTMGRTTQTVRSSDDEILLLKGLADQASVAIENARLNDNTTKRAKLLKMLDSASLDISDPMEVNDVLRKTIERATDLLEASGGAIYLFTSTTRDEELVVRASYGKPPIPEGTVVSRERGVVGEVVKTKKPFSKSAYHEWTDRQQQFDNLRLTAVIGVPVTCGENLLGVMALHQNEEGSEFTADQMDILLSFGKHAGAALEKAQMLEEQIKTGNLIEALVSELDDETFKDKILDLLGDHYPDAYCEILQKDRNTNELRVVASNFPATFDRNAPIKVSRSKGVTAWVASTGKTKIIRDVRDEKLYIPALPETRSEIAVPLTAGTKVMGVLNIESKKVAAFTERDERVLTRLAAAIGAQVNQEQRIDQAKRQMEQSQILSEFRSQVIGAPELNDKLEIVSKKLLEISKADLSVVILLTGDGRHLCVRAAHADDPHSKWNPGIGTMCSLLTIPHLADEVLGASHKVYKMSEPFGERLLNSLSDHISLEQKLQSVLLIPLKGGATFAGLCILGSLGLQREVFTDQQIGAAVTIAERAAPLIQQARTLELERGRGQVLKHLTSVGNTVTATLDQKKVFNLIDEYCLKLLNAEISTTFLVRRPGFLSLVSNSGSPPGAALIGLELEIKEGNGLTGHIAKEGKIFNQHGDELLSHPAIKSQGPHPHLPSGYCSSILAVPLKKVVEGKEEVIGLLKVENKKDQSGKVDTSSGFNNEDELVLQTLASFAVTAIQNSEHFAFATALQSCARVVNSSIENYTDVLERVLAELQGIIPFDTASIQLLSGNVLKVKACKWFDEEEKQDVLKLSFPLIPRFPNEQVMRTKKPLLINDVRTTQYEHFWKEKMYCSSHIRSWLGVPLMLGDEAIGMLSIESNKPSFYTKTHEEQSQAFANQIVPAISNAQMYRSADCLIGLVEDLTKHLERNTVLQKIADDAIDKEAIIGADKAIIYEYDADRATFQTPAVYAGELKDPKSSNPPFTPESIVYRCTNLKRYHLAPHVNTDKVLGGPFTRREEIASAAVFPLLVDDQLVGLMFINYVVPHDFTTQEVRVMDLFARHAAIAIHNARQYDILNKRMEVASAAARIGRIASIWAHDVQAPTFRVRLLVDMLRPRLNDKLNKELLEKIYEDNRKISEIIPGLPDRHETERVDLNDVIDEVKRKKEKTLLQRKIHLKADLNGIPPISGNSRWMVWILIGLFNNAARFMPEGGTISISGRVSNKRVLLDVIDTGPGLTDSVRNQLFLGKVIDPQSNGRGWSLLLIKDVLNDYSADLILPRKDDSPNVFTLDLPLAPDQEVQN